MPRQNASSSSFRAASDSSSIWPAWALWIVNRIHTRTARNDDLTAIPPAADPRSQAGANEGLQRRRQFSEPLESRQMLSAAVAPISFLPAQIYSDARAQVVAAGDFNNDGKPDLVSTDEPNGIISILINAGDGTFLPQRHYFVSGARGLTVADFNGDGNQDIAVLSNEGQTSTVHIFYGNGDGTFSKPPMLVRVNFGLIAVAARDMNGDGRPDLIITTSKRVIVLLNDGGGAFSKPVNFRSGPGQSGQLVVADFNGDGINDVAMIRRGTTGVSVLLGKGDGTLGPPAFIRTGTDPQALTVGDFNGDGKLDIAVANSDFRASSLNVLIGNGDGTFAHRQPFVGGNFVDGIAAGDFNGDGRIDIATVSFTSDTRIYAGNGDGTFQPLQAIQSVNFGQYTVAADFNGDGKDDLAIATGSSVKVLLANAGATPPPPAPASLDFPVGAGGTKSVTYRDVSGSLDTLSLTGPGSAIVHLLGDNLALNPSGTRVIGGAASLSTIVATGTTDASVLHITPLGRNATANVGAISTDGSFGAILAPLANLIGNITVAGTVRAIDFNNVSNGTIAIQSAASGAVNLTLNNVSNESLITAQPIGVLAAAQWVAVNGGTASLSAPSIKQIKIRGAFSADISNSGSLGLFTANSIAGGTWDNQYGNIGAIHVQKGAQFNVYAGSIGNIVIGNSLINSTVKTNTTPNTSGNIGSISVGTLVNSTIALDYVEFPSPLSLPLALTAAPVDSSATLGSIKLGRFPGTASFANSTISAPTIGRLSLGSIAFANGGLTEGITAHSVALLAGSDAATGIAFSLTRPVTLEALTARGISTQDFVLDIV